MTRELQTNDQTVFINDLSDFFRELRVFEPEIGIVSRSDEPKFLLWYRGQTNSRKSLLPKLYRKFINNKKQQDNLWKEIQEKEGSYLRDFKIRNYHMISRQPKNDLTWMSIMQHYGIPTRLLDWSENALCALFFALEKYFSDEPNKETSLPGVWCLKPLELNRLTVEGYKLNISSEYLPDMFSLLSGFNKSPVCPKLLKIFFDKDQDEPFEASVCWPLSILPPYSNDRIRAQSGTFTLFPLTMGKSINCLDLLGMENLPDRQKFLKLFILIKPKEISYELKSIGVKRGVFYPEMPSITYDIEQELNLRMR